jgi:hypothetical protein
MRRINLMVFLGVAFVLALFLVGQAQPLTVIYGKVLTEDGKPVTNQPLVIEGRKGSRWIADWLQFGRGSKDRDEIQAVSVTDHQGAFQVINLPAGYYSIKLLRPGAQPILVREFKLDRGYDKSEIIGTVAAEKLGRDWP